MSCGLRDYFLTSKKGSKDSFPANSSPESFFTFSTETIDPPPEKICTSKIKILKLKHVYNNSFRIDQLWFYADKETYRYLGYLIISSLITERKVDILIENNRSYIKKISILSFTGKTSIYYGTYKSQPLHYKYIPRLPNGKYPFECIYKYLERYNLPLLLLTNEKKSTMSDLEWEARNILCIDGNEHSRILLGGLLLNISLDDNHQSEFILESEPGSIGVAPTSVEAAFLLPGHYSWDDGE